MSVRPITVSCRAKLNLFLDVVGRRDDGYHDLVTVFHEVALDDDLTVAIADDGIGVDVDGDEAGGVPVGDDNLVVRAARALLDDVDFDRGLSFRLTKRIPMGAGLGGGSADAAGSLRAAHEALGFPRSTEDLERIALTVGSDVPFLVRGGTALAHGRGERLRALSDVAPLAFLLLVPEFLLSTAAVYRAVRIADTPADPGPVLDALAAGDADALSIAFHNALLPAAESVDPRLADVRRAAESALGRRVCMTGSGSTLFVPLPADTDLEPAALTIPGIRRMLLTRSH